MKNYVLDLQNITKQYPGVIALNNVSFKIIKGQISALVGENGAGKSTLLKIISGVIPFNHYQGVVKYHNLPCKFTSLKDSEKLGITIIHQELAISPHLSLFENIFVGSHLKNKYRLLNWNKMILEAKYYMNLVGLNISPTIKAGSISAAQAQLLEIARALAKKSRLLILDEPTSSLNEKDAFNLLKIIKKLKVEIGLSCIFVSHKLNEVKYLADQIIIIRDGQYITSYDHNLTNVSEKTLIKDIVGRELKSKFPQRIVKERKIHNILELKNFNVKHLQINNKIVARNCSLAIKPGEIVGLSGLIGAGRSEFLMNVFGHSFGKRLSGEITWKESKQNFASPAQAIKKGLMYLSEDRKNLGLIPMFSIAQNINMAARHIFSNKLGIINHNLEINNALYLKKLLKIKAPSINFKVENLSGGNQQKVLIAKALSTKFSVLIIDEPTRGIDVGSKYEIYQIIFDLAKQGKAIIVISSELEELLGISDKIYVMAQGEIKGFLSAQVASQEKIMQMAIGS